MSTSVVTGTPPGDAASMAEHVAFYQQLDSKDAILAPPVPETPAAEPAAALDADAPPAPDDAPAGTTAAVDSAPARDEAGKFTKGNRRHDPRAAVAAATGELAKERAARIAAEDRARVLEARVAPAAPVAEPTPPVAPERPKLDDFQTYEAYVDAVADWKVTQALAKRDAEQESARARSEADRVRQAHQARFTEAATDPDFQTVIEAGEAALASAGVMLPTVVQLAIIQSEHGPEIARYLGAHPAELLQLARRYANTTVDAATAVQDALELRLTSSAPVTAAARPTGPAAPATPRAATRPIEPVRASRPAATDSPPGDSASNKEHFDYWDRKEREARTQR